MKDRELICHLKGQFSSIRDRVVAGQHMQKVSPGIVKENYWTPIPILLILRNSLNFYCSCIKSSVQ